MRIRLVSDLHVDINGKFFDKLNNDFLFIAGDTAGSLSSEFDFLEDKKFIAVGGNHLGYEYKTQREKRKILYGEDYNPTEETKEDCIKRLTTCYNKYPQIYLENSYVKFDNVIVFGGTMYSDFLLYGKDTKEICENTGRRWLNDFRNVYTFDKKQKTVRPIDPKDYETKFKQFKRALNKCLKETTEDIIVISHFCPSIKSISEEYINQRPTFSQPGYYLNACYASNLEHYIKKNPRIKIWMTGHVHHVNEYEIAQCKVISCPYGYFTYEQEIPTDEYKGKLLDIETTPTGQITQINVVDE